MSAANHFFLLLSCFFICSVTRHKPVFTSSFFVWYVILQCTPSWNGWIVLTEDRAHTMSLKDVSPQQLMFSYLLSKHLQDEKTNRFLSSPFAVLPLTSPTPCLPVQHSLHLILPLLYVFDCFRFPPWSYSSLAVCISLMRYIQTPQSIHGSDSHILLSVSMCCCFM